MGSIEYFTEVLVRQPLYPLNYLYIDDWERIVYTDPVYEEAIFWSSPSLHTELRKLKDNTLKLVNRDKVIASLYKYFVRVSSRCTPFGINAGFYIDNIGNEKSGSGVGSKGNRIVTPDLHFVNILISFLSNIRKLRSKMRFYKNPTIYTIGGTYRYFESYKKGMADAFRLSSVQAYSIIDEILSASTSGCYWNDLLDILGDIPSLEEKESFLASLVNEKLIISEIEYNILSNDIMDRIISLLELLVETEVRQVIDLLKKYRKVFNSLLISPMGVLPVQEIHQLREEFCHLFGIKDIQQLFQIDLHRSAPNIGLNENDVSQLKDTIDFLCKLTKPGKLTNGDLTNFKKSFFERYDNEIVRLMDDWTRTAALDFQ